MQILPENILRWMTAEDRRKYAKGQMTQEQAIDKFCRREEKALQKQFRLWCLLHQAYLDFSHARMDKPTTTEVGLLDFHVWTAKRHCFVEWKSEHGRLSDAQKAFIARQGKLGVPTLVTNSFTEATAFVRTSLFGSSEPVEAPR
jgi:hypothetical protein